MMLMRLSGWGLSTPVNGSICVHSSSRAVYLNKDLCFESSKICRRKFDRDRIWCNKCSKKLIPSGAIVNPNLKGYSGHPIEKIKFDVAVEAGTGSEIKGNGGIKVLGGIIGAKGKMSMKENEKENTVSRISFTVPVCFPPPSAPEQ